MSRRPELAKRWVDATLVSPRMEAGSARRRLVPLGDNG